MRILGGTKNDFVGTKRVFGPHKQILRVHYNNFGGTNELEFERTKQGFRGQITWNLREQSEDFGGNKK